MPLSFWTEERVERLKQLADEGLSSSQMGAALGITRNAALGKLHRLGICSKFVQHPQSDYRPPAANPNAYKRKPRVRRKRDGWRNLIDAATGEFRDLPPEIVVNSVSFIDLERHHCRWPVHADGEPAMFCGAEAFPKYPYCARHCAVAYRAPGERMTRAEFEEHGRKLAKNYQAGVQAA